MRINSYSFGSMTVEGKSYNSDLIVFPERVKANWWRKEGHSLAIDDLKEVLEYKPEFLIIGKGAFGVMQIPNSVREALKNKAIVLIESNTNEAYKIFNKYIDENKKVVGAFHLTC